MKGFPKYKICDKVHFELIVDDKKVYHIKN